MPHSATEPVPACLACASPEAREEARVRAQMHPSRETFRFVRCGSCGSVYLSPRVPAEKVGDYYPAHYLPYRGPAAWGIFAPLVAAGLRGQDRRRVRRVRAHAPVTPETRVLDVGCGKPSFLEALVRKTGCRATGVDFSDAGWRDEPDRWAGMDLRVADPGHLELAEGAHLLTMWHYLEHDYDPAGTLNRLREGASAPGARLFIEVPDHDSWTRRRHGAGWAGYHAPRHTALYSPSSLSTLLERTGWVPEVVVQRGSLDPWLLHWMSRMEARGVDWSGSLARHFPGFLLGKLAWMARFQGREEGLGVLTAVARRGE